MGKKILIAEDDPGFLKTLTQGFRAQGFTVYPATTCMGAVELLYDHTPDCFLLDYHLADDNAQLACFSIRNYSPTKEAPIVIISGDETIGADSYENCQADAFVVKCHGCEEALAAINRQLRRAEARAKLSDNSDIKLDYGNTLILPAGKPPIPVTPEQFRFFAAIFEQKRRFVSESDMNAKVYAVVGRTGTSQALATLAQRLKEKFSARLAKRIRHDKYRGWIYAEPCRMATPAKEVAPQPTP